MTTAGKAARSFSPVRRRPPAQAAMSVPPPGRWAGRRPGGVRQLSVPALACIGGAALVLALCLLAALWPPQGVDGAAACLQSPAVDAPRIQRITYTSAGSGRGSNVGGAGGVVSIDAASAIEGDTAGGNSSDSRSPGTESSSASLEDGRYTVVLNSFKRHDLLKAAVKHYGGCPEVDAVRVVWSEDSKGPPSQGEDPTFYAAAGSAEVVYDVQQSPSLNNRFRPLPGLRTLAVLSIDDDIRVPCHEVAQTFDVWRQHPDQLVGWFPRGVHATVALRPSSSGSGGGRIETGSSGSGSGAGSSDGSGGDGNGGGNFSGSAGAGAGSRAVCRYGYLSKDSAVLFRGSYSLVLTKGAFLHRDWLSTYTAAVPPQVAEYIDAHRNCEDIAMSFLVSNATGLPAVYDRAPSLRDLGQGLLKVKGISSLAGHAGERSACLNAFAQAFGGMPLQERRLSVHKQPLKLRLATIWDRAV